jgi:3-phenylpropionate/trans-cinnamate dioxygenase ferredoxin subunit
MQAVSVSGLDIAVARTAGGALAAFDQWCSHEECPLADGDLEGDRVLCYCHSSEFDIWTGAALRGPATEPIAVYEVRAVDGEVHVAVPDPA